jgi:hypothetical protein
MKLQRSGRHASRRRTGAMLDLSAYREYGRVRLCYLLEWQAGSIKWLSEISLTWLNLILLLPRSVDFPSDTSLRTRIRRFLRHVSLLNDLP